MLKKTPRGFSDDEDGGKPESSKVWVSFRVFFFGGGEFWPIFVGIPKKVPVTCCFSCSGRVSARVGESKT